MTPRDDATIGASGSQASRRAVSVHAREGSDGLNGSGASERPYATGGTLYGLGLKGPVFDRDHIIYPDGSDRCVYTVRWEVSALAIDEDAS